MISQTIQSFPYENPWIFRHTSYKSSFSQWKTMDTPYKNHHFPYKNHDFPYKNHDFPYEDHDFSRLYEPQSTGLAPGLPHVTPAPPRQHVALQQVGWCTQHSSAAPLASRWPGEMPRGLAFFGGYHVYYVYYVCM
jgi:hypothetical protein